MTLERKMLAELSRIMVSIDLELTKQHFYDKFCVTKKLSNLMLDLTDHISYMKNNPEMPGCDACWVFNSVGVNGGPYIRCTKCGRDFETVE